MVICSRLLNYSNKFYSHISPSSIKEEQRENFLLLFAANFTSLLSKTPKRKKSEREKNLSSVDYLFLMLNLSWDRAIRSFPLFYMPSIYATQAMNEHHSFQPLISWKCNFRQYPNIFNNPYSWVYIHIEWHMREDDEEIRQPPHILHNRHKFPQVTSHLIQLIALFSHFSWFFSALFRFAHTTTTLSSHHHHLLLPLQQQHQLWKKPFFLLIIFSLSLFFSTRESFSYIFLPFFSWCQKYIYAATMDEHE